MHGDKKIYEYTIKKMTESKKKMMEEKTDLSKNLK